MTDYYSKYMKYKMKYIELKNGAGIGNTIAKGLVAALMSQVENLKKQVKNMKPEDVNKTIKLIEDNLNKLPEENRKDIIKVINEIKEMINKAGSLNPVTIHPASI